MMFEKKMNIHICNLWALDDLDIRTLQAFPATLPLAGSLCLHCRFDAVSAASGSDNNPPSGSDKL